MGGFAPDRGGPLVIVGDVVTDVVCRTIGPWRIGTDTPASIEIRPGGSAANTSAWAAWSHRRERSQRLTVPTDPGGVVLIGRVGPDDARWHCDALREHGVDAQLVVDTAAVTTRLVALIDDVNGERTMLTDRGAGLLLEPHELDEAVFAAAGWVHLSGYLLFADAPRRSFLQITRWCAAHGVSWSVDPASSGFLTDLGVETARALLTGASIGFPNSDEALVLAGLGPDGNVEAAAASLCSLWETVVVTCGAAGALVARGGEIIERMGAKELVVVLDAVGAGDAFAAAWIVAHRHGFDSAQCLQRATDTALVALGVTGGRPASNS